ncbi:MAG: carboxypeptidase-like regulatory domain-containing protein, partial [Chthoniobacterales bacterium]
MAAESAGFDAELTREAEEINELNSGPFGTPNPHAPVQKDGALQFPWGRVPSAITAPTIPGPSLTFEGIPVQSSAPPDTTGAVGPNDYVQGVNTVFRVFDKAGVPRAPAFKLSKLFAALGGVVASTDNGDPIVIYDRMADRWLLSQFAFTSNTTPPFHEAIAISKTGDPTGEYWVYDFVVPGNNFPDYSKFGAWPDGYYMTDRQFTNGGPYAGPGCFAFDRAKMLVGDPSATFIYFNAGLTASQASSGMIPSDFYGITPPPAGAPNVFAIFTDDAFVGDTADAIRLFNFHADFAVPANSTFTERAGSPLPVAAFDSRNPAGRADIEEPAPAAAADYIDSIGDRLMLRMMYFNRGGTETLTTCHTVNAGTIPAPGLNPTVAEYKAATRYYILQKTTPGGAYSVLDQATFSPDTVERWMGSTATDNAGNLAVGYSISNTSVFPGIGYAGRLLSDPPNTLSGEQVMFNGTGVQIGTSNRWGDYSNMSLDPTDDASFWYTQEYYATSPAAGFAWQTRVGTFKFTTTTAPPQGTLSGTVTVCDTGAPISDAIVQVTGGASTGFSSTTKANGTYSIKLSPGSYQATIVDPAHNCTAIGPFPVTITNAATSTLNGCLSGTPKFALGTLAVSGGNGDTTIDRNECVNLNIPLQNIGCLAAPGVTATLSATTPGVFISQGNSGYATINENLAVTNTTPFQVSTQSTFPCGTTINFTLTITSPSGGSVALPFTMPTCVVPPATINGALAAGDLQEPNGRLGRNAVASNCGTAKACPGPLGTGARLYDQYTFTNGPT